MEQSTHHTPISMNTQNNKVEYISLSAIQPSSFNPRKQFPESEIQELTASVQANAVLQAILVCPQGETLSNRVWRTQIQSIRSGWLSNHSRQCLGTNRRASNGNIHH